MTGTALASGVAQFAFIAAAIIILLLVLLPLLRSRRRVLIRARRSSARARGTAAQTKHQVAAVPVRRGTNGQIEVLVISTRGSGRWTVPKGWPMRGRADADAAAQEAYEEAGVRGCVVREPIGAFDYVKRRDDRQTLLVTVYRLDVDRQVRRFRERGERDCRWLPVPAAADCIAWPGLAEIIRSLESTRAASGVSSLASLRD